MSDVPVNLGPREARRRLWVGVGAGLATVGLWFALRAPEVPHVARLALFLPAWVSALGLVQRAQRT